MIFTGIEILFFVLGILTTIGAFTISYYHRKLNFKIVTWITICIGLFLLVFTTAWSFSSVLEGEPRAASMGLIVFGIPSIILLILGRKLALRKEAKKI